MGVFYGAAKAQNAHDIVVVGVPASALPRTLRQRLAQVNCSADTPPSKPHLSLFGGTEKGCDEGLSTNVPPVVHPCTASAANLAPSNVTHQVAKPTGVLLRPRALRKIVISIRRRISWFSVGWPDKYTGESE